MAHIACATCNKYSCHFRPLSRASMYVGRLHLDNRQLRVRFADGPLSVLEHDAAQGHSDKSMGVLFMALGLRCPMATRSGQPTGQVSEDFSVSRKSPTFTNRISFR